MAITFFPSRDTELLAWSLNFSTLITATPTAYGLTSAQATAYAAVHDAYATALAACDPTVRNKAAVAAKNTARTALKDNARLLANLVYGTATVTDSQKIELGLTVRAMPSPIPAPSAAPKLTVKSVVGRTVKLQLENADVTKRAKPGGVQGAAVFSHVGDAPPDDISAWVFEGNTTKTIIDVVFAPAVAPAKVWFTAFWYNPRAMSGPACDPISANIQFGGVSMAA